MPLPNGPDHVYDRGEDCEGECVGEVSVEGQLDEVPAQLEGVRGLHQAAEDPEADGRLKQGQRQRGQQNLGGMQVT